MDTYTVVELLSAKVYTVESDTCQNAAYQTLIDILGLDYKDFTEVYGKHTFNLVSNQDDRIVYSVLYRPTLREI